MKNFLLTLGLITIGNFTANAQVSGCTTAPDGMYPTSQVTPTCDGVTRTIASWAFTSDYSEVKINAGTSYEFSATLDSGQPFITIEDKTTGEILVSGQNKVVYTADVDKVIKFYSHLNASCGMNDFDFVDRKVKCLETITAYCEPVLGCDDGAVIKSVKFADLLKTSTCSPNGFNDFTEKFANVKKGNSYDLEVEIGYGWYNQSVSVWIDYNKNFQFDADEFIYVGTIDQGTLTKSIPIRLDVADGDYRMRVRLATVTQSGATATKACDITDAYGETEDYTLKLHTQLSTNDIKDSGLTLSPNPVKDVLNISSNQKIAEIVVFNINGQIVRTATSSKEINLKSLPVGNYIVQIKTDDNNVVRKKIIKK